MLQVTGPTCIRIYNIIKWPFGCTFAKWPSSNENQLAPPSKMVRYKNVVILILRWAVTNKSKRNGGVRDDREESICESRPRQSTALAQLGETLNLFFECGGEFVPLYSTMDAVRNI